MQTNMMSTFTPVGRQFIRQVSRALNATCSQVEYYRIGLGREWSEADIHLFSVSHKRDNSCVHLVQAT